MKLFLAITASTAVLLPVLSASPAHARCQDGVSYIVVPNQCHDLSYINIVNASQVVTASVNAKYRSELRANIALDNDAATLKHETREERDARYRALAKESIQRDKVNNIHGEIEAIAFRRQLQVLNEINGTLAPRR